LQKVLPVIDNDASDSGMFDNALEMFLLAGRSLPHALMMMVPEPWTGDRRISKEKRAFYEYHSLLSEPWDGPAAIVFSDGFTVGALLDRNGLRPARYYITDDDLVVLASEVGVLDIPAEKIASKGSLKPGNLFVVDTNAGRIIGDDELKETLAREHPYQEWLDANMVTLDHLPEPPYVHTTNSETILQRQRVFGYTYEELRLLLEPMAATGNEPIGSMGTDTPLAILSERPQLFYTYFKQLFAQVTNPPVDAIREELVMSADTCVGPEVNMLEPSPECARQIRLSSPILTNEELEKLRLFGDSDSHWGRSRFKSLTIPIVYSVVGGGDGLATALDNICEQSSKAIEGGYDLIILSDRNIDAEMAPIPALLAVGAVHHHLIREGTRTHVGLIVESGEPREVHHFALLLGYGAAAINPYLAFETLHESIRKDLLPETDEQTAVHNYVHAINKGIIKVISKMGISTTQGYCGAQIFEAIGLDQDLIDKYFTWTPSRIGGANLEVIAEEERRRHSAAFVVTSEQPALESGGHYQYRKDGEPHLFNPLTVHKLQAACRTRNYATFKEYSALVNNQSRNFCTLRGVMEFRADRPPVSIDEV
ncbi:MAG TPA: glutamate synthase central domain-containing protein, partial [Pyrinomonadaceae bacterium]